MRAGRARSSPPAAGVRRVLRDIHEREAALIGEGGLSLVGCMEAVWRLHGDCMMVLKMPSSPRRPPRGRAAASRPARLGSGRIVVSGYVREFGVKRMSGGAKRQCDRALSVPRVRSHCRFRKRGTDYTSEYGIKWVSGSTKRHCEQAPGAPSPGPGKGLMTQSAASSVWHESGVRSAQTMPVGPCISVGLQL